MQASLERLRRRREELGDEGGFTLIELLIVIVILGILAAIVVFAVQNLTSQSVKASCGSDVKTVETGLETFKAQVGHYPTDGTAAGPGTPAVPPAQNGDNWATAPGASQTAGTAPSTFADGIQALYATQPALNGTGLAGSSTVGPWLKDAPANGNSYRIWVVPGGQTPGAGVDPTSLTDGNGSIVVQNLQTTTLKADGSGGPVVQTSKGTDGLTAIWTYSGGAWVPSVNTGTTGSYAKSTASFSCADAGL